MPGEHPRERLIRASAEESVSDEVFVDDAATAEAAGGESAEAGTETVEDAPVESETAEAEPVEAEAEVDPAEALEKQLRLEPGDWYVVHSYAGYENKVKANLETRVQNLDLAEYIFQVEVPPTEEVTEIKNGQRKQVNRKVLPGYILVRMELNDESWGGAVRNTPGVTGFVGATSRPSPLTIKEVVKFLLPQQSKKKPAAGAAATGEATVAAAKPTIEVDFEVGESRDRDGRTVRDAARIDQRGQRRAAEAQGPGVDLRSRDPRGAVVQPGLQDLIGSGGDRPLPNLQ